MSDGRVEIGPLATTQMMCGEGAMEVEVEYLSLLAAATASRIENRRLIFEIDGETVLEFGRLDASLVGEWGADRLQQRQQRGGDGRHRHPGDGVVGRVWRALGQRRLPTATGPATGWKTEACASNFPSARVAYASGRRGSWNRNAATSRC